MKQLVCNLMLVVTLVGCGAQPESTESGSYSTNDSQRGFGYGIVETEMGTYICITPAFSAPDSGIWCEKVEK